MKFRPIFALRMTHAYYTDDRCPDFLIEPNLETERLLRNHRCVLKSLPDGIRVLTAVDDQDKPFIAFPEKMTFTFHLRIQNPDFALFTDLRTAWFSESFGVVEPALEDHFALRGRPLAELNPEDFKIEGSEKVKLKEYDPTGKVITVNSSDAQKDEKFTVKYPIEPRLERGVFADAEIHWTNTASDHPVEFQIAFTAKRNLWKYYFVTNLKPPKGPFKIVGTDSAAVFNDQNRTDLNQNPDSSDDIAEELRKQYPDEGFQRFRFISDNPIPCRQAARKDLKIHRIYLNPPKDDKCLFKALPNPSIRNYTKIEVKPVAEQDQQDALFHVVKYITQPF